MTDALGPTQRDAEGNPCWTFIVCESHLQHNSRVTFPPAVADALGCKPNALRRVSVEDPAGCRKLLVAREQQGRTIIRRLSEPLRRMRAGHDQRFDLVVTGPSCVTLRPTQIPAAPQPSSATTVGTTTQIAPWGSPPTPLLPRWYLDAHGSEPLPTGFTSAFPEARRVRDLRRFWELYDPPRYKDKNWSLRDFAQRLMPPGGLRVLDDSIGVDALLRLPLQNRTRNCVRQGSSQGTLGGGTVAELMRLPGFGITSLLDLMCLIEAAHAQGADAGAHPASVQGLENCASAEPGAVEPDDGSTTASAGGWHSDAARLIAAAARELRGAATVGDLLRLDLSDLITAAGAGADLDEFPLETDSSTLADLAVEAVAACLELMSETQRMVVLGRLATSSPTTLQELANTAGLSRERIRQLSRQATEALEEAAGPSLGLLALAASERLGDVTTKPEIEEMVIELLPQPRQVDYVDSPVVARWALFARLGYACRDHLCLSPKAVEAAKTLKEAGTRLTDDAGLIDSEQLRQVVPPELHDDLDALVRWVGWHRLSEHVAPRATARARVKAALLKIGAPATKAELAQEGGMTERQVGGALSSIASVARATKDRWGLREWIDDVYEGIPAEIIQRINEDGGSTRLNRLLEELPRLFEVSETSVWAYLNTPAFRVEHGWVSESRAPDFDVGRLESVIDGIDDNGDPCWTFEIAQRHLEGYSLHGVPPEIAVALGCNFGSKSSVSVRSPDGCQDISVIWRKTSMHGPEIGRLGPALKAIGATPDTTTVCLVIHDPSKVSFRTGLPTRVRTTPLHAVNASEIVDQSNSATPHQFNGVRTGIRLSGRLTTATGSDLSSLLETEGLRHG